MGCQKIERECLGKIDTNLTGRKGQMGKKNRRGAMESSEQRSERKKEIHNLPKAVAYAFGNDLSVLSLMKLH